MKFYDYEENTNKIPYDKEPIHRQATYKKTKQTSFKSSGKIVAIALCALLLINVIFGVCLIKLSKNNNNEPNNTIININSQGAVDVSAATNKAKLSVACVHAGLTSGSSSDPDYQGFFNMASKGAGVIFKDNKTSGEAYLVTCFHVVKGFTSQIYVLLYDSFVPEKATLVYYSSIYDIAVVKLSASSEYIKSAAQVAEIADSSLMVEGEASIAIGNPLGVGISATSGIISKTTDLVDVDGVTHRVMRTSAPINAGNSGGGLFDLNGRFIGLVSAKANDNASNGNFIDCVAYAIPSNVAISIAENIVRNKMPVKAVVGFSLMVDASGIKMDIINGKYIPVQTVVVSKADNNGKFELYDKIIGFSYGSTVVNMTNLYSFDDHAFNIEKGDKVKFFVERDGEEIIVEVTITEDVSADYQDWYKA